MVSRHRVVFVAAASLAALASGLPALAQSKSDLQTSRPEVDLGALIERMQKQDKEAADDMFLLEKSKNARNYDNELSFGTVDDGIERPYSIDPTYEEQGIPAIGLNLKMGF